LKGDTYKKIKGNKKEFGMTKQATFLSVLVLKLSATN
jgi:hypothetical protein